MVGFIAIKAPEVLGTRYGWIQQAFKYRELNDILLIILIMLPLIRIVATSFSIGSGAQVQYSVLEWLLVLLPVLVSGKY